MKKHLFIIVVIILVFFTIGLSEASTYVYPLKRSEDLNIRYLVDQNDMPFFWAGDAAWSLIVQLTKKEVLTYLDDRRNKGFTIILVNLLERKNSINAPSNIYSEPPFIDKIFGSPNEKYFSHVDFVLNAAAERGLTILLAPVYLGWKCIDDGWCPEIRTASNEDMLAWGRYLGKRYKNFDNIVWLIGGDNDPTPVKEKLLKFIAGLQEFDNQHLFTAHNQPESFAIDPWQNEKWLTINNIYSYSKKIDHSSKLIYENAEIAYNRIPVMPFFLIESTYENEHNATQEELRAQAYWSVLGGSMGYIFGNCPIWHFGGSNYYCKRNDWQDNLNAQGSLSMSYLNTLFQSRPWYKLIPDYSHKVLIQGYGQWRESDYVTAARTDDGNTVIAYLPKARQFTPSQSRISKMMEVITNYLPTKREITINMSTLSGNSVNGWWYNPSDGTTSFIGKYPNSGLQSFTLPNSNDWVLVLDNASLNISPPGMKN